MAGGARVVLVYTLWGMEMEVSFWGIGYVPGMLTPLAISAFLGPSLLRW